MYVSSSFHVCLIVSMFITQITQKSQVGLGTYNADFLVNPMPPWPWPIPLDIVHNSLLKSRFFEFSVAITAITELLAALS